MSKLAYHSSMLCGWHPAAPALQTATEGARHTMPQNVEEWRFLWKLLHHCWRKVPTSGIHYVTLTHLHRLSLWYSDWNNIAFFTCEPVTCLSFAARAFYQSQLRFFHRPTSFLCGSLLISTFIFDILQIPSGSSHICSGCSALTCLLVATVPHWLSFVRFKWFFLACPGKSSGCVSNRARRLPSKSFSIFTWFSPYHSTLQSGILIALLKWTISSLINPYKITIRNPRLPVTLSILNVTVRLDAIYWYLRMACIT
jgi:hypothetical protein